MKKQFTKSFDNLEVGTKTFNVYKNKDGKKVRTKISISAELYSSIYEQQLCGFGCEDFIKIIQNFIDENKIEKNISQSVTAFLISRLVSSAKYNEHRLYWQVIARERILKTYFINIDKIPDHPDENKLKPFYNEEYYKLPIVERDKIPKKGDEIIE